MASTSSRLPLAAAITALVTLGAPALHARAIACGGHGQPPCPVARTVAAKAPSTPNALALPTRGLPRFTFAPATPAARATATSSASVTALVTSDPGGASSWWGEIRIVFEVLVAAAAAFGLWVRLYPEVRRRLEPSPRKLAWISLERRLEELWGAEERRLGGPAPAPPGWQAAGQAPSDRLAPPARRY